MQTVLQFIGFKNSNWIKYNIIRDIVHRRMNLYSYVLLLTVYIDGLILSPNTTCPKFSTGDSFSSATQKSKLQVEFEK